MIKKILSVLMAALCFAGCICVMSDAASAEPEFATDDIVIKSDTVYPFDVNEFISYMSMQFDKYETHIDISSFGISRDIPIYSIIYNNIISSFNLDKLSLYYGSDGIYSFFEVKYLYAKDELNELMKVFNANANYLLRGLNTGTLSDEVKAVILHDRLVSWCEYDYESFETGKTRKNTDMAFGAVVMKLAVCSGYARAYMYLLGKVGVKCDYVNSDELNHAWNVVTVNGKKYHVDLTWDDPVGNMTGHTFHNSLLLSTQALRTNDHDATDFDSTPTDTRYDNSWWKDVTSEIQLLDGSLYYVKSSGNKGFITKRTGNTEKTVVTVDDKWPAGAAGTYYTANFTSLCDDGEKLFYNTKDSVYYLDKNGNTGHVCTPNLPVGKYIYGISLYNGELTLYCQKGPNVQDYQGRQELKYRYKESTEDYPEYEDVDDIIDGPGEGGEQGGEQGGSTDENVSFIVSLFRKIVAFFKAVGTFFAGLFA